MKERQKITIPSIVAKKSAGEKITMITSYDWLFASLVDDAGADIILVGDSLGMVFQGEPNTLSVTLEQMIYHCRAVKKGARYALVVLDMPFMSYQVSPEQAVENCGRAIKEGLADAVKLEGGAEMADTIKRVTSTGIPVMAHIGLRPQSSLITGGYKVEGKDIDSVKSLIEDLKSVEESGAFSILIEGVPKEVGELLSRKCSVPTIGIGAGPSCDGQVLVLHDVLGLYRAFKPKFARKYNNLADSVLDSVRKYCEDVKNQNFPSDEECYHIKDMEIIRTIESLSEEL